MKNRKELKEVLTSYSPFDSTEAAYVERLLNLLEYPNCYERSLLIGHLTASCWVVSEDHARVLLLHHVKLNKWLQPGGHADGDEDLPRVAKKELDEETGLSDYSLVSSDIFDIDIHSIPERKEVPAHEHYDVRFLFRASNQSTITKNHESNALEWVSLSHVPGEISLQRMVKKTKLL